VLASPPLLSYFFLHRLDYHAFYSIHRNSSDGLIPSTPKSLSGSSFLNSTYGQFSEEAKRLEKKITINNASPKQSRNT
jgi:hypothetical protein